MGRGRGERRHATAASRYRDKREVLLERERVDCWPFMQDQGRGAIRHEA